MVPYTIFFLRVIPTQILAQLNWHGGEYNHIRVTKKAKSKLSGEYIQNSSKQRQHEAGISTNNICFCLRSEYLFTSFTCMLFFLQSLVREKSKGTTNCDTDWLHTTCSITYRASPGPSPNEPVITKWCNSVSPLVISHNNNPQTAGKFQH
jgi:hypothetical protein